MALNFGSFFEKLIGQDLRDLASKSSKSMNDFANSFSDVNDALATSIDQSSKAVQELSKVQEKYKKRISELTKVTKDNTKTDTERARALRQVELIQRRLAPIDQLQIEAKKKLATETAKVTKDTKDYGKELTKLSDLTWKSVMKTNQKMVDDHLKGNEVVSRFTGETLNSLREIEQENFASKLGAGFNEAKGFIENMGKDAGGAIGDLASDALGEVGKAFGPLGVVIGKTIGQAIGKAVAQMMELNKSIIEITRATGGMIDAAALGVDSVGNITGTFGSLKTAMFGANISMEEFSGAIGKLMTNGMGNIAGAAQDIKKSGADIQKYGIEAARFSKMYGADISGTVRNMFMDFGKPIGDITDTISESSKKIEAAGLSVKQFVQNLEELTAMSGEMYFKGGIDAMAQMAETATRLGTSVSSLTDGLKSMNSLTDLYTEQQKAAAMGMHSLGRNMAKVFALKQAGKGEEAATLRLSSAAQDLSQFMDEKTGTITQQGIATAQGMGMSEEDIKNINKLSRGAKDAGVSFAKFMGPLEDLTEAEQIAVEKQRKANQTIEERWSNAAGSFMGSIIDPLAQMFAPLMEGLTSAFEGIMSVVNPLIKAFMGIMSSISPVGIALNVVTNFISEMFNQVGEIFGSVGKKLDTLWKKIEPAFSAIGSVFSWVGKMLGKIFMVPMKILGAVVGWVIDGLIMLVDFFKWIWGFLEPIFSSIGDGLSSLWSGIKTVFGYVGDAVGAIGDGLGWLWDTMKKYIIDPIANVLGPIFDFLGEVIDFVLAPFRWLADAIKAVIEWFGWFEDEKETVVTDAEAVQAMTNDKIAAGLNGPTVPEQSLDAGKSVAAGTDVAEKASAEAKMVEGMTQGFGQPAAAKEKATVVNVKAALIGKNEAKTNTTTQG